MTRGRARQSIKYLGGPVGKTHWFAWRVSQWPLVWKQYTLLYHLATPFSWTLGGLFKLRGHPSRALILDACLASGIPEIKGHCQVCWAGRGAPRTPSITTQANLDCALVKTVLVFIYLKIGGARPPCPCWEIVCSDQTWQILATLFELSSRPPVTQTKDCSRPV